MKSNSSRLGRLAHAPGHLHYARRALRLVWQAAGAWSIAWLVLLLLQGFLPAFLVYLTKWLVDTLASMVGSGFTPENVRAVLVPAGLMGVLMLGQQVLGAVEDWIMAAQSELVQDYVKGQVHAKAAVVDYGLYETAEFHDRMEQAGAQASSRSLALLQNLGGVLQTGITFLSIAAILISYHLALPLVLLVSALPALMVLLRYNRKYHAWWRDTTPERRKAYYFDLLLTNPLSAGEVRMYRLGRYLSDQYQRIRRKMREERLAMLAEQITARLFAGAVALVAVAGVMAWMVWRALNGRATLGDLALFYQGFNQAQGLIRSLLNNMGQVVSNAMFVRHLFDFLDEPIRIVDPPEPVPAPPALRKGIEFRGITFRYPGAARPALENFNLFVPAGQTVAIVGPNGAGKSTLIKLLCRFYDPEEGSVLLDDVDIRQYAVEELRSRLAIMFQFPVRYTDTVAQNIGVGNAEEDRAGIEAAARSAGAHDFIARLPYGYDTLLGKVFTNGVELSGGEWQRIALARAYVRQAPIVALDEPTSSMDSWAEEAWYDQFAHLVRGRTAILITHRFTTAKRADHIYVVEGGHIIEHGTHEALVLRGGRYAASWNKQTASRNGTPDDADEEEESPPVGFSAAPPVPDPFPTDATP